MEVLVGGGSAYYTDSQQGIEQSLPIAGIWVILSTFVLLFLFTGSVILPIKAILLNVLSLGATLGLLGWIFQNGHLQWLLGEYSVTGTIDTSSVVMIALVAFGLSMDYELFLLSRIKEQHDAGYNTYNSVVLGLQRSGRIITAAALILAPDVITSSTKITDRPARCLSTRPVTAKASRKRSYRSAAVAISKRTVGLGRTRTSDTTLVPIRGAILWAKMSA